MKPSLSTSSRIHSFNQARLSTTVCQAKGLFRTQGSAETVLARISLFVSNPNFNDYHFLAVLNIAEDYDVRPKIALIQNFLWAKGRKYTPRRKIIAVWLRAAVKLDLMRGILELGNATLKISAIVEAWEVADKLNDCLERLGTRLVG